jgi:hypothetical protein
MKSNVFVFLLTFLLTIETVISSQKAPLPTALSSTRGSSKQRSLLARTHHHPSWLCIQRGGAAVAANKSIKKTSQKAAKPTAVATTATAPSASSPSSSSSCLLRRLKIGFYFGLWYALNVYYNSKSYGYRVEYADISSSVPSHPLFMQLSTRKS